MKTLNLKRLSSLMLAGSFGLLHAPTVFAVAGDTIGNTATLSYSVNSTPQTVIESAPGAGNSTPGVGAGTSTDFVEDRRLNVTVGAVSGASLAPSSSGAITFTVTNNSNAILDMSLSTAQGTGDDFDTTGAIQFYVEDGTTLGFQSGEDTLVTFLDEMGITEQRTVYVVDTMPASSPTVIDGATADVLLYVQVAESTGDATQGADITTDDSGISDTTGVDDVFADGDGDAGLATDVDRDGIHSGTETFTIATAEVTVTKVSNVLSDPINGTTNPKAIPQAFVTYEITIANANTVATSADITRIQDQLPDGVAANTHSVTLDPDYDDGTGTPTSGAGLSFEIDTTGTSRPSAGVFYCRQDGADGAGCNYSGGSGGLIDLDDADNAGIPGIDAEPGYTQGELKPGEQIVIRFNVIID